MQRDLNTICNWLNNNLLSINVEKTNYIIFEMKNQFNNIDLNNLNIVINNTQLNRVKNITYLGLEIDNKLNWNQHINHVKSKINSTSYALRRLSYILPERAKWFFFHSCIMSHISYLNPIWNIASLNAVESLEVCLNRSLRVIKKVPRLYPTNLLYSPTILPLKLFNKYSTIFLIYKIKNQIIKCNQNLNLNKNRYETRQVNNFEIQFSRTNIGQNNIFNYGLNLFNNLPSDLKETKVISEFKNKVKKLLYENELVY